MKSSGCSSAVGSNAEEIRVGGLARWYSGGAQVYSSVMDGIELSVFNYSHRDILYRCDALSCIVTVSDQSRRMR